VHAFQAQQLVTVRGGGDGTFTQSRNTWLDLSGYQDLVAWLDIQSHAFSSGTLKLAYQTAMTDSEDSFMTMQGPATTMPLSTNPGLQVTPLLKDILTVPLARWFRWQITATGTSGWSLTFRLFLAANCVGNRERARALAQSGG